MNFTYSPLQKKKPTFFPERNRKLHSWEKQTNKQTKQTTQHQNCLTSAQLIFFHKLKSQAMLD